MHFTPKDWSFAYFSFLGVGKLLLAEFSNHRCRWHRQNLSVVSLTPLNSLSPVSLTPVININSRISPRIFEKAPMEYLGAWGTLIHEKNLKSKISFQTPFKEKFNWITWSKEGIVLGWYLLLNWTTGIELVMFNSHPMQLLMLMSNTLFTLYCYDYFCFSVLSV